MPLPPKETVECSVKDSFRTKLHMKRKYSIITVLIILAAFGLLYLMSKSESVSGKQNELEQKIDDLESRIEDIRQ